METGTHEELMEKKGFYYQLVLLQTMVDNEEGNKDGDGGMSS